MSCNFHGVFVLCKVEAVLTTIVDSEVVIMGASLQSGVGSCGMVILVWWMLGFAHEVLVLVQVHSTFRLGVAPGFNEVINGDFGTPRRKTI